MAEPLKKFTLVLSEGTIESGEVRRKRYDRCVKNAGAKGLSSWMRDELDAAADRLLERQKKTAEEYSDERVIELMGEAQEKIEEARELLDALL